MGAMVEGEYMVERGTSCEKFEGTKENNTNVCCGIVTKIMFPRVEASMICREGRNRAGEGYYIILKKSKIENVTSVNIFSFLSNRFL